MTNSGETDRDDVPLRQALSRLDGLRSDLREARHLGESGDPLPPEELTQRLDEVDLWLDELIAILGDRTNGLIEP